MFHYEKHKQPIASSLFYKSLMSTSCIQTSLVINANPSNDTCQLLDEPIYSTLRGAMSLHD